MKKALKRINKKSKEHEEEQVKNNERYQKDLLMIKAILDIKIRIQSLAEAPKFNVSLVFRN